MIIDGMPTGVQLDEPIRIVTNVLIHVPGDMYVSLRYNVTFGHGTVDGTRKYQNNQQKVTARQSPSMAVR